MRCRFHTVGRGLVHVSSDRTQCKTVGHRLILKSSLTQVTQTNNTLQLKLWGEELLPFFQLKLPVYIPVRSPAGAPVPVNSLLVSAAEQRGDNRTVPLSVIQRPFSLQLWGGQSGPPPALLSPPSPAWEHHLLLRFKGTDTHLSDTRNKRQNFNLVGLPGR